MRQGSNNHHNNRRGRGRSHGHNNARRNHHGNRNQNYDSNGPLGRIRGTAKQIYDKYLQQAKDAMSSGDRILAESLFQHADHYGRIVAQFAPKPRPEEDQATDTNAAKPETPTAPTSEAEVVDLSADDQGTDGDQAAATPEVLDLSQEATDDSAQGDDGDIPVADEKPKRRPSTRGTQTRRTPRKKAAEAEKPTLGGGTNAVPDFLARPVEVDTAEAESVEPGEGEEKPKRRRTTTPRKTPTRTRRKKTEDADAPSDASAEQVSETSAE